MVATRLWLSELHLFFRSESARKKRSASSDSKQPTLGILAFETARTMAQLISLYNSLSPAQIQTLRNVVFQSEGIQYLNSSDEFHLIYLAFTEKIEELDRAAAAVSRLGVKCQRQDLRGFDHTYTDLKIGAVDLPGLSFTAKEIGRKIAQMEKHVLATADLYSGLESLSEMEASERKLQHWKSFSGPIPAQKVDTEMFEEKMTWQRQHVQRMRNTSLWSQPFDDIVLLMARFVYTVFSRICVVFGPYVSDLPQVVSDGNVVSVAPKQVQFNPFRSGPLERSVAKDVIVTNSGPLYIKPRSGIEMFRNHEDNVGSDRKQRKRLRITEWAEPTTVGGAGLALLYATVVIRAESLLNSAGPIDADARENLYQMLPAELQTAVNVKIRKCLQCDESWSSDKLIVEGWREALGGILGWLAPLAHKMVTWQAERSLEQQRFDSQTTVLLLETLYFSDREKTEAAIAEVLVGLSCILRHQDRRSSTPGKRPGFKGRDC
ncbi:protein PSK SIMULATOR 1-like [Magnolia sinica]|uniref:protein PSK SIMULATOR 1-like n=1 Tax=Magnolia sinica TaxID=86752 RepID=UPI002658613E|nr:protein PSK SIMULATOR 1-like [Magnolia sinica]